MPTSSYVVPNLVAGISHQAPEERHPNQVEDQQNCINSPLLGVVARPSLDFTASITATHTNAAFYEIFRNGVQEHYLLVIDAGSLYVYDLADGTLCTVTDVGASDSYLTSSPAKGNFRFQTIDDYTFIGNTGVTMAMTSATQPARPPEALVFVKAGGYSVAYSIAITYGGHVYTWTYTTPDNSTVGNAPYINTAQIAATFYDAMASNPAPVPTSGDAAPADYLGGQAIFGGANAAVGAITAVSLGFSVEINGNVLRIWRASDTTDFQIAATDGVGNTYMAALKGQAQALSDLPQTAMVGFRLQIQSQNATSSATAFYVQYTADGVWEETLGPGEHTTLDPATMPHALINTGYRTFTYGQNTWDGRIVGDINSAPLPYAVGKTVADLGFYNGRLAILDSAAVDFSKTRNEFCFFPDTVQADLATAPISIPIQGARSISIAQRIVLADESFFVWAQQAQFRLDSGAQPFQADYVNNKLNSAYQFEPNCPPLVNGSSIYFAVDLLDWCAIKSLNYSAGRAAPALDVTAHIPDLIPAGARFLSGNDAVGVLFVQTDGDPTALYLYNYVVQGNDVVQSAWNRWVFPCDQILWSSVVNNTLYVALQRGSEFVLATVYLLPNVVDPGGGCLYSTRLDLRLNETQVSMSYNATTGLTTVDTPTGFSTVQDTTVLVLRLDPTVSNPKGYVRGSMPPMTWTGGSAFTVPGDITGMKFYLGVLINAYAVLSDFYPRITMALSTTAQQAWFYDRVTVRRLAVSYAGTSSFQAIVALQDGTTKVTQMTSRKAGVGGLSFTGPPDPATGFLDVPVKANASEHTITLQNNTPWPSRWQRLRYIYESVNRGAPDASA